MSGRALEIVLYELLKARQQGDEARARLLVGGMSQEDLAALAMASADITVTALVEVLTATGHEDPNGWVSGFLDRVSAESADRAVSTQGITDPPPFNR